MSMLGKASFRISSFFCVSVEGLGGFGGGAASAAAVGEAMLAEVVVVFWMGSALPRMPVSWTSSSSLRSKGLTVVGDSGAFVEVALF